MIRNLLLVLTAFIMLSSISIAQPILTANGINPGVGETYAFTSYPSVSPGNPGANQTWNLSSIGAPSNAQSYTAGTPLTPTNSPYANANVALQNSLGTYYYISSGTSLLYNGFYTTFFGYCGNMETILSFPFNYQDSLNDSWNMMYTIGSAYSTTGNSYVTYDGYGTLILPTGTYNNVVRIHYQKIYDDYNVPASSTHGPYIPHRNNSKDGYKWYLNGNHQPIAETYTLSSTDYNYDNITTYSTFDNFTILSGIVTGINDPKEISSTVSVYPNPATNEMRFNFKNNMEVDKIEITDISGKVVIERLIDINARNETNTINTTDLKEGIYFAKFSTKDGQIITKKISILK